MDDWQRLRALVAQAKPAEQDLIKAMIARLRPVAEIEAALRSASPLAQDRHTKPAAQGHSLSRDGKRRFT